MQLEIDCIEWVLKKIEVNKIPNDRLEAVTRVLIKDLEKRKDKAMKRSETDDLWTKIESLQWILFVIITKQVLLISGGEKSEAQRILQPIEPLTKILFDENIEKMVEVISKEELKIDVG